MIIKLFQQLFIYNIYFVLSSISQIVLTILDACWHKTKCSTNLTTPIPVSYKNATSYLKLITMLHKCCFPPIYKSYTY